ncbi:hypothetical protein UA08_03208 [Talaromyces atroroseus]|uniref:DUF7514 domain-containing protein n=1 Tax=Talaromyces atroroseus TaxID=1441469 RepID=A0A225AR46_TALAT|nr:hypothetical protein UA08_03208 [Talaromyces atroroseus]OKL60844.1 hypothetical protein UA08_03208 [Talaromyces atroroseus]
MAYDSYYDPSPPRPQEEYANEQTYNPPYPSQHVSDQIQMPHPRMPSPSYQNPPTPLFRPPSSGAPYNTNNTNNNNNNNNNPDNTNNAGYLSPELISQVTATVIQQLKAYGLEGFQGQQQSPPPPPPAGPAVAPVQAQPVPSQPLSTPAGPEAAYYNQLASHKDAQPQPQDTRAQESISVPPERRDLPADRRSATAPDSRSNMFRREPTQEELTTVERIWGRLFDNNGQPTPRLGQLLRGIAVHLIEDYPPGNTMVVLPDKMQKYYADTKISTDTYPWHDIFDDRTSSISRIYRSIEAEHHLVQDPSNLKERPDIPGLTPRGFEKWYTLMIQANPDREFSRLQKTVLDMPISNPDDKKERFPKELPRRLFPSSSDISILEKLEASIIAHCEVELPRNPVEESSKPPSSSLRTPIERSPSRVPTDRVAPPVTVSKSNSQEREATSAGIEDEEDTTTTSRPIERERKPYSAQPGGGKVYEETATNAIPKTESASAGRQSHIYAQDPPYARGGGGVGPSSTNPTGHSGHMHHASISSSKPGHRRSSSVGVNANKSGDYRHSEPDLVSYEPSYMTMDSSGHHYKTSGAAVGDSFDDDDRLVYRDYDRDDSRDYELLRERERERERRYHDHLGGSGRSTWNDEDYYRGLLGGQGGGPEYKYR